MQEAVFRNWGNEAGAVSVDNIVKKKSRIIFIPKKGSEHWMERHCREVKQQLKMGIYKHMMVDGASNTGVLPLIQNFFIFIEVIFAWEAWTYNINIP